MSFEALRFPLAFRRDVPGLMFARHVKGISLDCGVPMSGSVDFMLLRRVKEKEWIETEAVF